MSRWLLCTLLVSVSLTACSATERRPTVRNHSFAQPEAVVMTHLDLDLVVDFGQQQLQGTAALDISNRSEARELHLDTWALQILDVRLDDDEEAKWTLGDSIAIVGRPLIVEIRPETQRVTIRYRTTDQARALQWLTPAQTQGRQSPFLYTQSQSILARSWVPCQDTPEVRFTYSARVQVPTGLLALMSASNTQQVSAEGLYRFDMPQAIPAYLLALTVGDLKFRAVSKQCGVYAEPAIVEAAAWEFADMGRMMSTVEEMYGPYRWERFDVVVMPPSYPFGGMENPRLTFVTPILVAGDRSLVSTIAHELAHSWSGNLVTNADWEDFWLNEGFTTYLERRIMERLYGREVMEMEALLGRDGLVDEFADLGENNPDTALRIELTGRDPDEVLGTAAYEKGYLFLRLLEETYGRGRWDAFLRGYFDRFAFRSITTDSFLTHLEAELLEGDMEIANKLRIQDWIDGPGLPSNAPELHSKRFEAVAEQIAAWDAGAPARTLKVNKWSTSEWDYFLTHVSPSLTQERMRDLDTTFQFLKRNGAIQRSWFRLVIQNQYEPAYPALEAFLLRVGRRWFIRPLYTLLVASEWGRAFAERVYEKARPGYHSVTANSIDLILGVQATR